VSGLRKLLHSEIRCYELFYVQTTETLPVNHLRYMNQLKGEKLNGQRLGSLVDSNIAISKRFATKLNDVLQFTKQTNSKVSK
jgi:hypothetical protein